MADRAFIVSPPPRVRVDWALQGLACPSCESRTGVVSTRATPNGNIRRVRECPKCKHRFATIEVPE
jgi:predicted Zn finger-like uncharacterized protein